MLPGSMNHKIECFNVVPLDDQSIRGQFELVDTTSLLPVPLVSAFVTQSSHKAAIDGCEGIVARSWYL